MKRKFICLLVLCILLLSGTIAYAQDGIEVTLEEPNVSALVKGEDVTYRVNVNFKKPLDQFINLFVTLRISEGLDFKSVNLVGVEAKPKAIEVISNPNQEGRYGFVTLRVTDIKALEGKTKFSFDITSEVNGKKNDGDKLTNTFTVSFQYSDFDTKYYQISQDSTALVASRPPDNIRPEEPTQPEEPQEEPQEEPKEEPKNPPNVEAQDTTLTFKTGGIYAIYMDKIEGVTNVGNTVEFKIGANTDIVSVDSGGKFIFPIAAGVEEDIIITALNSNNERGVSKVLRFVTDETLTREEFDEMVESLKKLGYEDIVYRYLKDYEDYTNTISIILGTEGGARQEQYEFLKKLYYATRSFDVQILVHDPFMNGYPEGNFLPGNAITRAEAAAILSRIIAGGEVAEESTNFPDVPSGKWYSKYIAHLEKLGIMKGYKGGVEDGKFMPMNKITRAEFATIISRHYKLTERELVHFSDLNLNHWAADDIMRVATAGIMEGYPEGTFGPALAVTRAEAATILNRAMNRIPDKAYIDKYNITGFTDIKNHWGYYQIVEATTRHEYVMENGVERYRSHP